MDTRELFAQPFMWRVYFFFFVALLSRYSNVMLRPVGGFEETLRIVHQLVRAERLSPQRFASFARPHLHAPWMAHVRSPS